MINWHTFFFLLFALISCAFAVGVVLAGNIVRMAVYLVVSLGAVSGLFFLAGADMVGAMQLMIYVGGTLVLLVFGVMLTAQGPFVNLKTAPIQWVAALLLGAALLMLLVESVTGIRDWSARIAPTETAATNPDPPPTATRLGMGMVGVRVDQLDQPNDALRGGMSGYLLPFEIISVHLLVVLIASAYLARSKVKKDRASTIEH